MLADFMPELLAESDDVVGPPRLRQKRGFSCTRAACDRRRQTGWTPKSLRETVIRAEVNRAAEDAFKPVDEPTIVLSIARQTEFFKHFGAGTEVEASPLLPASVATQMGMSLSCPNGSPKSG